MTKSPTGNITKDEKDENSYYYKKYILLISIIAALGGLMFGYDLGVIAGVVPFIQKQFNLGEIILGWVVAIFEVGCMVGTIITGWLADKFGRKKMLIITSGCFLITTVGAALSLTAFQLSFWRFAQGLSVGAASVLSPMYIAEIAPASMRGKLVSGNQLSIVMGVLLATIICYYVGDPNNTESWRWMFGAAFIPSSIFFLSLFLIPESPRWLVKSNNNFKAKNVLNKIGNSFFVEEELKEISQSIRTSGREATYGKLFNKSILPIVLVGFGVALISPISGGNEISSYMQIIFAKADIDLKDGLFNGVLAVLVLFIFTVLAILVIEKIGRRKLLLFGTSTLSFILFLLAWSFINPSENAIFILILIIVFGAIYAITLGPVPWVLLSEIFPNYIRSKALSLSSCVLWLSTFLIVFISPYLLKLNPVVNFIIFAFFNLIGFAFVLFYIPETRGKTLEEIENIPIGKRIRR